MRMKIAGQWFHIPERLFAAMHREQHRLMAKRCPRVSYGTRA